MDAIEPATRPENPPVAALLEAGSAFFAGREGKSACVGDGE